MLILRSLLFNIAFYINIIVLMICGLPLLLGGRKAALFVAISWAKSSLWLLERICGLKVEYRGLENLPQGAALIASKHQSFLEGFALIIPCKDFSYILKRELIWLPGFGLYLQAAGQIGINRSSGRTAITEVLDGASRVFSENRKLIIFPEGTRRPVGAPPQYRSGVAKIYATNNVPCIPVALAAGLFWPRRSFLRYPGTCIIDFLPAVTPGLDDKTMLSQLESAIEQRSQTLTQQALSLREAKSGS